MANKVVANIRVYVALLEFYCRVIEDSKQYGSGNVISFIVKVTDLGDLEVTGSHKSTAKGSKQNKCSESRTNAVNQLKHAPRQGTEFALCAMYTYDTY